MVLFLSTIPRLSELPEDVSDEFTYGGRVELSSHHIIEPESSNAVWTNELIQKLRFQFRNNILFGAYGKSTVQEISRHLDEHMTRHVSIVQELEDLWKCFPLIMISFIYI